VRLFLDTNIALDFMLAREPYNGAARKLMLCGFLQELELWISGAQLNDLIYILTKGGKPAYNEACKQSLQKLRQCVKVYPVGEQEIDATLNSNWPDLEDACLYQAALGAKADFIITRNPTDFVFSTIKTLTAEQVFDYIKEHQGITYDELS
jgi:predicted nucleic acid-binding protein